MKGFSFKQNRPPETVKETEMFQALMAEVNKCYVALALNCDIPVPEWVDSGILPSTLAQFMIEIRECNRMTAFIRFVSDVALLDITFCKGSERMVTLSVMYDGIADQLRVP